MPTYNMSYIITKHDGNGTAIQEKERTELILAKNKSYAQLSVLQKHSVDNKNICMEITKIDIILDHQFSQDIH